MNTCRTSAALWAEILSLSISDAERLGDHLQRGPITKSNPIMQDGLDAIEWIFHSRKSDGVLGSFHSICEIMDIDPTAVRSKLATRPSIITAGKFYRRYVLGKPTQGVIDWRPRRAMFCVAA